MMVAMEGHEELAENLKRLGDAIESRIERESAPPVRRSFARMRTEDDAREEAPEPWTSTRPTKRMQPMVLAE